MNTFADKWNMSTFLPEGGTGELLFSHSQLIPELSHLRLQYCILVLALDNEVLQALCHVQLTLCHLLYPKTKL